MTEYEEAREAIKSAIKNPENWVDSSYTVGNENIPCDDWQVDSNKVADQILKLPNIAVLAKDQPIARVLLWQESIDADRQGAWIELPAKEANFKRVIEEK
jgi:hypothetical protein